VIHARQFTDRAAHIKAQLDAFEIPFEFIEPYDAEVLNPDIINRFYDFNDKESPGQKSCTLKHFEALRKIAANEYCLALVLEDDAVLDRNFTKELSKILDEARTLTPPYTIQIGSGGNMFVPKRRLKPGQRLYEADQPRCTDSYLIGAQAARERLDWLEHNKIDRPTDHLFNLIDRQKKIKAYWSDPAIVEQGSMNGLFSSALDDGRKDKPLWLVKLRFAWQRLRRKYIYRFFQ